MFIDGPKTQILEEATADNNTQVIYTVPAGKKLYLVSASLHVTVAAPAAGLAELEINDDVATHKLHLCSLDVGVNPPVILADHFQPCWVVELEAGWNISVISGAAGLSTEGDIFGFETDA